MSELEEAGHCCAATGCADSAANAAAIEAIATRERARRLIASGATLGASPRCRCPVENRDVSLSLDASTERKGDDIENAVNRLTRKRCG